MASQSRPDAPVIIAIDILRVSYDINGWVPSVQMCVAKTKDSKEWTCYLWSPRADSCHDLIHANLLHTDDGAEGILTDHRMYIQRTHFLQNSSDQLLTTLKGANRAPRDVWTEVHAMLTELLHTYPTAVVAARNAEVLMAVANRIVRYNRSLWYTPVFNRVVSTGDSETGICQPVSILCIDTCKTVAPDYTHACTPAGFSTAKDIATLAHILRSMEEPIET